MLSRKWGPTLTILLLALAVCSLRLEAAQHSVKVYISVDMEGIGGVTSQADVLPLPNDPDYQMFRHIMTGEVNAAIRGAFEGGATYVLVEEHHGANGFRNILLTELDPRAKLIRGWPRPRGAVSGLDPSFKAAMFIGYHARAGTPNAILSHTFLWNAVADFRINGKSVGEGGFNATVAGALGVPVVMVSGDDIAVKQLTSYIGPLKGVIVKTSLGRFSGMVWSPQLTDKEIETGAEWAMQHLSEFHPLRIAAPYHVAIQYFPAWSKKVARIARGNPDISHPRPLVLAKTCANVTQLLDFYMTALNIGPNSPPTLGMPVGTDSKQ